jgi:hypothetical protein
MCNEPDLDAPRAAHTPHLAFEFVEFAFCAQTVRLALKPKAEGRRHSSLNADPQKKNGRMRAPTVPLAPQGGVALLRD